LFYFSGLSFPLQTITSLDVVTVREPFKEARDWIHGEDLRIARFYTKGVGESAAGGAGF